MRLYQLSGKKIKADEERVLFGMFYSSIIRLNLNFESVVLRDCMEVS